MTAGRAQAMHSARIAIGPILGLDAKYFKAKFDRRSISELIPLRGKQEPDPTKPGALRYPDFPPILFPSEHAGNMRYVFRTRILTDVSSYQLS